MNEATRLYIPRPKLEKPFEEMLASDAEPRVLNLHSTIEDTPVSGMGKSRLLEQYIQICEAQGIRHTEILDFRRTGNRYASSIIQAIAVLDPDKKSGVFVDYWNSRRNYIEVHERAKEALEAAYKDLEEEMDRNFIKGLDGLLAQSKVVVLLDTWEAVAGTAVEEWLHDLLLGKRLGELKNRHNLTLVIAGRPPLGWEDIPVRSVQVGPFTLEETKEYARSRGYEDRAPVPPERRALQIVTNVHNASGGHPVLVAWAFDYGDQQINIGKIALECEGNALAFRRRLVDIIDPVQNPILAWAACLHRRFDASILRHISGWPLNECKAKINQAIRAFPSIMRQGETPDSCELHDEVRDIIIEHGWGERWDPAGYEWNRLRELAVAYYDEEIKKLASNLKKLSTVHAYMAEHLFYILDRCQRMEPTTRVNCLKATFFQPFLPQFEQALDAYQAGLARSLLGELFKFADYFDDELYARYEIASARLLSRVGKLKEALEIYERVLKQPKMNKAIIAEVQLRRGRCYYVLAKYDEALKAYQESLELYKVLGQPLRVAEITRYIGMAYGASGRGEKARECYAESFRQALKIGGKEGQKQAASAADQAAQMALLLGDASMARALAQQALRIWERLNDHLGQARAMTTLGRIEEFTEDYMEAEIQFERARELYSTSPMPSTFGQAIVKAYMGRVYRRQKRLHEAEQQIKESIEIFKELNARDYLAFALGELGCIYREQEKWEKAEEYLQKALEIADEIKDTYRLAAVYEDLCELSRRRGDSDEQVEAYLRQAEKFAEEGGYKFFVARMEAHRGDLAFEAGNHRKAFDHYVKACHRFTEYHTDFYIRFLSEVEEKLYSLPMEVIPAHCDQMIKYWRQQGLESKYPALIDRFSQAKKIASAFGR